LQSKPELDRYGRTSSLDDVTIVIPHRRGVNEEYLQRAMSSFPKGMQLLVAENDNDLAGAMNEALETVDTEWVLVFNDDDVAVEGMAEEMCQVAFDADVVYPTMYSVTEDLSEMIAEHPAWPFCGNRLQQLNFVPGCYLARTGSIREAGGWREMEALEDWDLHIRMYEAGARFKPAPEAKMVYRQRKGSRNDAVTRDYCRKWRDRYHPRENENLACFYFQATLPQTYLRCLLPARHLPGIATNDLWISHNSKTGEIIDHDIEGRVAVFQYPGDRARALSLVLLKHNGFKVWVEVDDDYLGAETRFMEKANWARGNDDPKLGMNDKEFTMEQHRWIVRHADGVLVTTEELARRYRKVNPNVVVAPNCVDPVDWEPLAHAREEKETWTVGWFASPSHHGDQRLIRRAMEWCCRQGDVKAAVMGIDPQFTFDGWVGIPWTNDLAMYRLALHTLDVGLAPVSRTIQGLGRSDIKATEYAMAGALPIVSFEEPYVDWEHGVTCLKAASGREFFEHVRWACTHRDEAREMAAAAKEWVLEHRNIERQVGIWREALCG
jgi:hypothetical protein